ncbi:MAG TPA: SH3 domain-containing protein [Phototrophicaceae bacterium]|nr:SH3 domain-containing protein [Phototrophicaceae bacterium]
MRRSSGPPTLLAFILAIALVFGLFYIWQGFQAFLRTGGQGVVEATQRADTFNTATEQRIQDIATLPATLLPTDTPPPPCQNFTVIVPAGIVRNAPSTESPVQTQFRLGSIVCVLGQVPDSDWYSIDVNPNTKRIEQGYMNAVVIEAADPTPTPSKTLIPSATVSPPPTVTITPSPKPTRTPSPLPSYTLNPNFTKTPLPSLTPSPRPSDTPQPFQSA